MYAHLRRREIRLSPHLLKIEPIERIVMSKHLSPNLIPISLFETQTNSQTENTNTFYVINCNFIV